MLRKNVSLSNFGGWDFVQHRPRKKPLHSPKSLIESFIDDKHHVIVTTHFSDLPLRLKTHAQIYLAGMEFHKGAPTYRILPDELGSSHAIKII